MMKRFLCGLAAALLCSIASAAEPVVDHPCWPSTIGGSGTAGTMKVTPNGVIALWFCQTPFTWLAQWEGMAKDYTGPSIGAVASEVAAVGVQAAWEKYPYVWTTAALALQVEANQLAQATRPADPVWKVAGTGSRPTYLVTSRSLVKNGTVTVAAGTLCTCKVGHFAKVSDAGNTTYYCRFDATPSVAYCTKR
jgi:hypothetical protein